MQFSTSNPPIVGSAAAVVRLREMIRRLAVTSVSVLITGESGVGKELVAKHLHLCSTRKTQPFVAVNCAALSAGILESELFGHVRGAFTGAVRSHTGLFQQADGGTLFLDEIGEIAPFIQAKLLRVLQEREVRRMGEAFVKHVDVRFICATNANIAQKVNDGSFREDLYYRVNVVQIKVPPLRERREDIPLLIQHFFDRRKRPSPRIADEALSALLSYEWPGNVRELENELERMIALHPDIRVIHTSKLSERILHGEDVDSFSMGMFEEGPLAHAVGYLEQRLLKKALAQYNWNKSRTARVLGLSRQGLLKKMKRYGIQNNSFMVSEKDEHP
ncbi:MAG: sigma-54 dependent transcriptional regulator [Candidatus Latescibacterota bacterium]